VPVLSPDPPLPGKFPSSSGHYTRCPSRLLFLTLLVRGYTLCPPPLEFAYLVLVLGSLFASFDMHIRLSVAATGRASGFKIRRSRPSCFFPSASPSPFIRGFRACPTCLLSVFSSPVDPLSFTQFKIRSPRLEFAAFSFHFLRLSPRTLVLLALTDSPTGPTVFDFSFSLTTEALPASGPLPHIFLRQGACWPVFTIPCLHYGISPRPSPQPFDELKPPT